MVIPWAGVPLHTVLKKLEPKREAKFVRFETLAERMSGWLQLPWGGPSRAFAEIGPETHGGGGRTP